jgi:hypothetical protein
MLLHRFFRDIFGDRSRLSELRRRRVRRRGGRPLPRLEALEDRTLPSLLGLAAQSVAPDIASGALTDLSYKQVGNNSNPFHYDAVPLTLTLGDGTRATISNPSAGGNATMTLDLQLDNSGRFSSGGTSPDFTVTGKVTVNGQTYDGTLLTAEARDFGFSSPNRTDTEFEVRLVVTGGLLAQQPSGVFQAGTDLVVLIHQSGLTIGSFPQSFSLKASPTGSSDTRKLRLGLTNSEPDGCG